MLKVISECRISSSCIDAGAGVEVVGEGLPGYTATSLDKALRAGELIEVDDDG